MMHKLHFSELEYGLSKNMPIQNKTDIKSIRQYVENGLKNGTICWYKDVLVDIKSLNTMINLDCLNCHKVHDVLCCDGFGYPPYDEDVDKVFSIYKKILRDQCSNKLYLEKIEHIEKYGLFVYSYDCNHMYETMETYDNRTFRMHNGKCIFSVPVNKDNPDGAYCCAIHAYALKHDIPVFELKPRACQLFPVDIIKIDNYDFVFGICSDTTFNRWGDVGYCVPYKDSVQVYKKTGAFNPKDYKPIYKGESGLLTGLYGKGIIKFIESKLREVKI